MGRNFTLVFSMDSGETLADNAIAINVAETLWPQKRIFLLSLTISPLLSSMNWMLSIQPSSNLLPGRLGLFITIASPFR